MNIYVAGTFHDPRISSGEIVETLKGLGHTIVSRWHDPNVWQSESRQTTYELRRSIAEGNYRDIDAADVVVAIPLKDHHLRGMHAEIGYALGIKTPVYVLGDHMSLNTMTCCSGVSYIPSLTAIHNF